MWLCTAIESLVEPLPGQSGRFNRKAIERAVIEARDDPTGFSPTSVVWLDFVPLSYMKGWKTLNSFMAVFMY